MLLHQACQFYGFSGFTLEKCKDPSLAKTITEDWSKEDEDDFVQDDEVILLASCAVSKATMRCFCTVGEPARQDGPLQEFDSSVQICTNHDRKDGQR